MPSWSNSSNQFYLSFFLNKYFNTVGTVTLSFLPVKNKLKFRLPYQLKFLPAVSYVRKPSYMIKYYQAMHALIIRQGVIFHVANDTR